MIERLPSLKDKLREKAIIAEAVAEVVEEPVKPKAESLKANGLKSKVTKVGKIKSKKK